MIFSCLNHAFAFVVFSVECSHFGPKFSTSYPSLTVMSMTRGIIARFDVVSANRIGGHSDGADACGILILGTNAFANEELNSVKHMSRRRAADRASGGLA